MTMPTKRPSTPRPSRTVRPAASLSRTRRSHPTFPLSQLLRQAESDESLHPPRKACYRVTATRTVPIHTSAVVRPQATSLPTSLCNWICRNYSESDTGAGCVAVVSSWRGAVSTASRVTGPTTSASQTLDVLNGTADRSALRDDVGGAPWVRSGFPNVDTEQRGKAR